MNNNGEAVLHYSLFIIHYSLLHRPITLTPFRM